MTSTPFLILRVLAAGHGDCLVIDYGQGENKHRVVIDGGTATTYPYLKQILEAEADATLELLVVTHVDADHIAGVLHIVQNELLARRFRDIWFNGRKHLEPEGAEPLGARQGDRLTDIIEKLGLPWNMAFGGRAVCLGEHNAPRTVQLASGAKVTLLSPRPADLQILRFRWDLELKIAGLVPTDLEPESQPAPLGLERMGFEELDVEQLAAQESPPDTSIPNATSIAFLFEYEGRSLLMAADAHADVLVNSGRLLREGESVPVDVFKLPHHASKCNVSRELLMQYPTRMYVVSTNGAYHNHPDDVALARVAMAAPEASLLFNYRCNGSTRWATIAEQQRRPAAVICAQGNEGLIIPII